MRKPRLELTVSSTSSKVAKDSREKRTARILKTPRRQQTIQKQPLRDRVHRQPFLRTVLQRPERRHDDQLRPLRNQLPPRLRERQVPADQQPDAAQRRVEDRVRVVRRRRQVVALDRAPQVLLHVPACDGAAGVDEVRDVEELLGRRVGVVELEDRPRDDVDVQVAGEGAVVVEVGLPLAAGGFEVGVLRDPV